MDRDAVLTTAANVLNNARSNAEYRRLSSLVDATLDERDLEALSECFEALLSAGIRALPSGCREEVEVAVNERLARACGAI